jgi:glucokinase
MSSTLVADIGGTKSRFGIANSAGLPRNIAIIDNDTVTDLGAAVAHYLDQIEERPHAGLFAVAGPIDSDEIALTNRPWRFRRAELASQFGFSQLRIINDFEAIAWALPRLGAADIELIGPPVAVREGVKVVLGPGTGLGVAALLPIAGHWHVVASEGGHVSFGPQREDELEVFARLRAECGELSAETVLSGPGLARLARAFNATGRDDSEAIIANARAGEPAARMTVRLFVRLLGRFAGGLALTFKALGGVYVAGGVSGGLGSLLEGEEFREAFEAHPPYRNLLAGIATMLITSEQPGLIGCAALAQMSDVAML